MGTDTKLIIRYAIGPVVFDIPKPGVVTFTLEPPQLRYAIGTVEVDVSRPEPVSFSIEKRRTVLVEILSVEIGRSYDEYEGDYIVTPRVYQQMLETEDKLMLDDVTVLPIPLSKVSNPQGGKTAFIG